MVLPGELVYFFEETEVGVEATFSHKTSYPVAKGAPTSRALGTLRLFEPALAKFVKRSEE